MECVPSRTKLHARLNIIRPISASTRKSVTLFHIGRPCDWWKLVSCRAYLCPHIFVLSFAVIRIVHRHTSVFISETRNEQKKSFAIIICCHSGAVAMISYLFVNLMSSLWVTRAFGLDTIHIHLRIAHLMYYLQACKHAMGACLRSSKPFHFNGIRNWYSEPFIDICFSLAKRRLVRLLHVLFGLCFCHSYRLMNLTDNETRDVCSHLTRIASMQMQHE